MLATKQAVPQKRTVCIFFGLFANAVQIPTQTGVHIVSMQACSVSADQCAHCNQEPTKPIVSSIFNHQS